MFTVPLVFNLYTVLIPYIKPAKIITHTCQFKIAVLRLSALLGKLLFLITIRPLLLSLIPSRAISTE